jgi:hypothetical protein
VAQPDSPSVEIATTIALITHQLARGKLNPKRFAGGGRGIPVTCHTPKGRYELLSFQIAELNRCTSHTRVIARCDLRRVCGREQLLATRNFQATSTPTAVIEIGARHDVGRAAGDDCSTIARATACNCSSSMHLRGNERGVREFRHTTNVECTRYES